MTKVRHPATILFAGVPGSSQAGHPLRLAYWIGLLLSLLLVATPHLVAQGPQNPFDSRGQLFWVTFIEGRGGLGAQEVPGMRLYISAVAPTTAQITNTETGVVVDIDIPVANRSYEIDITQLFGSFFELGPENLGFSQKSLRIEAPVDMTVYGVTTRLFSSDGFLALPADVLTGRYVLLAYPNGYRSATQFNNAVYDHPSEFAVVATEPSTTVTITPSVEVNGRPNRDPITVVLDAGDVYFVQANTGRPGDVTGTIVEADAPVALFSGNRRTSIPTSVGNFRDLLVEQMPPLESWGSSVILAPFVAINSIDLGYDPVARVVALEEATTWRRNGIEQPPLAAGRPIELVLTEDPEHIEADGPILVAQYEHSVGEISQNAFGLGDPFMTIIPPITQFDTVYSFQSIPDTLFQRHFVNVVIPTAARQTLRIDGVAVNAAYRLVPNTPYSYAQVELPEGAHHVEADAPFGIVCYGYGLANSYGYPGGMLFRPIVGDSRLPRLGGLIDCSGYRGHAVDNRLTDDGVDSVELVTAKSANVTFSTEPFASGADSVAWSVGLIDPYQDGVLVVRARDSAGWAQEFRRDVPGFTIGIGANGSATPAVERRPAYNGAEICVDVTLTNYGRFTQTVQGLRIESDPSFRVDTPFPLEIGPGGETDVRVCFASGIDTVYNVALVADNGCHDRDVALLEIVSILDTAGPTSLAAGVGCDAPVTAVVSFADGLRDFYGVADLSVVSIENGELASVNPSDFPASSIEVRVRQTDPFAETPFTLQVTDRAGNVTLYTDTLGAFTTHAYDRVDGLTLGTRTGNGWDVASIDFRSDRCDTILLVNEGTRPVELDRAHLGSNLGVSFPPSQLPVNVEPGDTLELAICFEGLRAGPGSDTLFLYDACGRFDKIEIATSVGFGDGAGVDRCGQQLHVQAFEAAKQTFLQTPFPSPSHGEQIGVDLGLDQDTEVSIDILDPTGLVRLRIIDESSLAAGVHRLTFTTLDLESGTFFCRLVTTEGEVHTVPFVLRK